jgi:hypothetical protein
VTGQCLVAVVEAALPADQQLRRHRARVVPPQLVRHTTEEGEGFDQAVQDRLGALARHGQRERTIGIRPGHQQHGDLAAAVGEIDVDVTEVGFEPLAGVVVQRDKRLASRQVLGKHVMTDALVAAGIAVLGAQPPENLGDRVPLLARRVGIGPEDRVDDRLERIDD